jgi:hypothetical protein
MVHTRQLSTAKSFRIPLEHRNFIRTIHESVYFQRKKTRRKQESFAPFKGTSISLLERRNEKNTEIGKKQE